MTWREMADRLEQFNKDYGIKKEPDIRQFSDMLYALGLNAEIYIGPRNPDSTESQQS